MGTEDKEFEWIDAKTRQITAKGQAWFWQDPLQLATDLYQQKLEKDRLLKSNSWVDSSKLKQMAFFGVDQELDIEQFYHPGFFESVTKMIDQGIKKVEENVPVTGQLLTIARLMHNTAISNGERDMVNVIVDFVTGLENPNSWTPRWIRAAFNNEMLSPIIKTVVNATILPSFAISCIPVWGMAGLSQYIGAVLTLGYLYKMGKMLNVAGKVKGAVTESLPFQLVAKGGELLASKLQQVRKRSNIYPPVFLNTLLWIKNKTDAKFMGQFDPLGSYINMTPTLLELYLTAAELSINYQKKSRVLRGAWDRAKSEEERKELAMDEHRLWHRAREEIPAIYDPNVSDKTEKDRSTRVWLLHNSELLDNLFQNPNAIPHGIPRKTIAYTYGEGQRQANWNGDKKYWDLVLYHTTKPKSNFRKMIYDYGEKPDAYLTPNQAAQLYADIAPGFKEEPTLQDNIAMFGKTILSGADNVLKYGDKLYEKTEMMRQWHQPMINSGAKMAGKAALWAAAPMIAPVTLMINTKKQEAIDYATQKRDAVYASAGSALDAGRQEVMNYARQKRDEAYEGIGNAGKRFFGGIAATARNPFTDQRPPNESALIRGLVGAQAVRDAYEESGAVQDLKEEPHGFSQGQFYPDVAKQLNTNLGRLSPLNADLLETIQEEEDEFDKMGLSAAEIEELRAARVGKQIKSYIGDDLSEADGSLSTFSFNTNRTSKNTIFKDTYSELFDSHWGSMRQREAKNYTSSSNKTERRAIRKQLLDEKKERKQ